VSQVVRYPDEFVAQGDPILTIESVEKKIKLLLPADLALRLQQREVRFVVESPAHDLPVNALSHVPQVDADGLYSVELDLGPGSGFMSGQIVRVTPSDAS
jgi:hypothetical protein